MQSCLARLYVSCTFRAQLRQNPGAALADYDLTGDEAAAIEAIDPRMLDRFAGTLVSKRRKRFERSYQASFALHGPAMHAVVRRYVEIRPARTGATSQQDTLEFGRFAEETFDGSDRYPSWATDLVRFERLSYEATLRQPELDADDHAALPAGTDLPALRPGVLIEDFQYDVVESDVRLRVGEAVPDPVPVANTVVFRPGHDEGGQRILRVNPAAALVLRRCDGEHTVEEIVAAVESELMTTGLFGSIRDAISRLQALCVLSVTASGD